MAWLDAFFGRVYANGVEIELSQGLDFVDPLTAALNQTTHSIEVGLADASVSPALVAPAASDMSVPFTIRKAYSALTPGTADDVTVLASAPFAFRILDSWLDTGSAAVGASTATLRTASGGGGTTLSSALDTEVALATARNSGVTKQVAEGGAVFLRRSDRGVSGEVILLCERT
jgi:hypothetical protein